MVVRLSVSVSDRVKELGPGRVKVRVRVRVRQY